MSEAQTLDILYLLGFLIFLFAGVGMIAVGDWFCRFFFDVHPLKKLEQWLLRGK